METNIIWTIITIMAFIVFLCYPHLSIEQGDKLVDCKHLNMVRLGQTVTDKYLTGFNEPNFSPKRQILHEQLPDPE